MLENEQSFADIQEYLINNGWGKDGLSKTLDASFCNIGKSFIDLNAHFHFLTHAMKSLLKPFELSDFNDDAGLLVSSLIGRVAGCFLGACRLVLSGQLSETYILMRAFIENALYAFYINESSDRADIWINRHKGGNSKKDCRDLFAIGKIFVALEQKSKSLKDTILNSYEETIDWGAHPNERSIFPNLALNEKQDGYNLFLINCDPDFMRACLVRLECCVVSILKLYELMFPQFMKEKNLNKDILIFERRLLPLLHELEQSFKDRKSKLHQR